jgi:cation diffusion facilitator CzcD-associated flavoprotein CzcO
MVLETDHQIMETKCDVLVVGAGLSGLSAARELRKRAPDLKVI